MLNLLMRRRTAVVSATVAALAAGGLAAYAAIPDSSGVITSCYDSQGAVKVIDTATTTSCPSGTTKLQWNQQGRTGPTGPRGAQGPAGPVNQHWAKFSADNKLIAASEKPNAYYAYGQSGYNYVSFTGVDVSKCAITVTPGTNGSSYKGVHAGYYNYSNTYILAYTMNEAGQFVGNIPMDVTANCTQYGPYVP